MRILVDKQEAIIKKDSSFEYISENRYFTGSDSYTLAITFPLQGCNQNIAIFGHINRKDILVKQYMFDCEILSGTFYIRGKLTITEITESYVKCQFLEGRSVQNYDESLDDVYINELDLGGYEDIVCDESIKPEGLMLLDNAVCIPWVNNTSGNMQNAMDYGTDGNLKWTDEFLNSTEKGLSYMPYLIFIFKAILDKVGYSYDLSEWENSRFKKLLICNCVPAAWDIRDWAYILPHWTISEFITEIENFMNCFIDIDTNLRTAVLRFTEYTDNNIENLSIKAIRKFTASVTEEDESEFSETMGKKYADRGDDKWKIESSSIPREVYTKQKMGISDYSYLGVNALKINEAYSTESLITKKACFPRTLFASKDTPNRFFRDSNGDFFDPVGYEYLEISHSLIDYKIVKFYPGEVGKFAPIDGMVEDKYTELKIIPARIDEVDKDFAVFIECGEKDDSAHILDDYDGKTSKADYILKNKDDDEDEDALFDNLQVAIWDDNCKKEAKILRTFKDAWNEVNQTTYQEWQSTGTIDTTRRALPHPVVSNFNPLMAEGVVYPGYFNLKDDYGKDYSLGLEQMKIVNKEIDGKTKYTIKFISDKIPNVCSIFSIDGQLFLCKKITATFRETGMSQLLKGEFYKIIS